MEPSSASLGGKFYLHATRHYETTLMAAYGASLTLGAVLSEALGDSARRFHVIADHGMLQRHPIICTHLQQLCECRKATLLVLPGGERAKSLVVLKKIFTWFDAQAVRRRSEPVVAFGGGALLDVASFATSLFRRGIPLVKVPSTLLAVVDAGLGAKTAINYDGRKNLIGTYDPPAVIILDLSLVSTTSRRSLRDGIAEMMKIAAAKNRRLWLSLERNIETILGSKGQSLEAQSVIFDSVRSMTSSIWPDLWERRLERPTDFGHSVSKALEEEIHPRPSHGEAVVFDMVLTMATAAHMNLLPLSEFRRFMDLAQIVGFNVDHPAINGVVLERGIEDTYVHRDGSSDWPIPTRIGNTSFYPIELSDVLAGQRFLRAYIKHRKVASNDR